MSADSDARLVLNVTCEPGDPRLHEELRGSTPQRLVDRLAAGDERLPQSWRTDHATAHHRVGSALVRAERHDLRWVTPGDPQWPSRLRDLNDVDERGGAAGAPLGLWVRGAGDLRDLTAAIVAVVGARGCTTYGAECAGDIAADCSDAGITVVSGAAFGIDACAHRGALLATTPTLAVLACGADLDYPRAHGSLLHRICESGLVVSEQPPGAPAQKQRFLSRNRIIAALAEGTVVIEAARRSGSLNTLHWADQLSRATMVLPGPVTSQLSSGCHAAVRAGEATLITSAADVMSEVYGIEPTGPVGGLPIGARRVWQALRPDPLPVGDLALNSRMSTRDALRGLVVLRGEGLAVAVDAQRWRRAA